MVMNFSNSHMLQAVGNVLFAVPIDNVTYNLFRMGCVQYRSANIKPNLYYHITFELNKQRCTNMVS